jgi:hypothetical protein
MKKDDLKIEDLKDSEAALIKHDGQYGAAVYGEDGSISVYLTASPEKVEERFRRLRNMREKQESFAYTGFELSHRDLNHNYKVIIFPNVLGTELHIQQEGSKLGKEGMYSVLNHVFEGVVYPGDIDTTNKSFHPGSSEEAELMLRHLGGYENIQEIVKAVALIPKAD